MTIRVIIIHTKEEEEVFPESPETGALGRKMWPGTLHHLHHPSIRAETGAEVEMHLLKERLRVNTLWGTGWIKLQEMKYFINVHFVLDAAHMTTVGTTAPCTRLLNHHFS